MSSWEPPGGVEEDLASGSPDTNSGLPDEPPRAPAEPDASERAAAGSAGAAGGWRRDPAELPSGPGVPPVPPRWEVLPAQFGSGPRIEPQPGPLEGPGGRGGVEVEAPRLSDGSDADWVPEPPAPIPESCRDMLGAAMGDPLPSLEHLQYGDEEVAVGGALGPWGTEAFRSPAPRSEEADGQGAREQAASLDAPRDSQPVAPFAGLPPPARIAEQRPLGDRRAAAPLAGLMVDGQAMGSPESILTPPSLSPNHSPRSSARESREAAADEGAGAELDAAAIALLSRSPLSEGRGSGVSDSFGSEEGSQDQLSTLAPTGPAWVDFTREQLSSTLSLHEMLPSLQRKLLRELRSSTDEVIFERDKRSGDFVVTVTSLKPTDARKRYPAYAAYKNLCEDTTRVRIRAADLPGSFPLVNRYSTVITDWRIAKAQANREELERGERSALKVVLPTKRTLSWMHKTVDAVFHARQASLLKEAAAARRAGQESFEPKPFSAFVDEYALCRLGDAHKASLFRQELEDACRRYIQVSPQARLMLSFLHGVDGPRMQYEERCLTLLLGMLQILSEVCPETRIALPKRFCACVERELSVASDSGLWLDNVELESPLVGPSGTSIARGRAEARQRKAEGRGAGAPRSRARAVGADESRTAASDAAAFDTATPAVVAAISLPQTIQARVVCLPRHQSFLFSGLRNATGDPRLASRLMQALQRENIWTLASSRGGPGHAGHAGRAGAALRGAGAAALQEIARMDSVEAEEYTVLEALVRLFEDLLVEVNGPESGEEWAAAGSGSGEGWQLGLEEEERVIGRLEELMG